MLGGSLLDGFTEQLESPPKKHRDSRLVCVSHSRDRKGDHPRRPIARGTSGGWSRRVEARFTRPVAEDGRNTRSSGLERLVPHEVIVND